MQFTSLLMGVSVVMSSMMMGVSSAPTDLEIRQSSTTPIDTAPLMLGACLAIGYCYYESNQVGCYTPGCGNSTLLGAICSCNSYVQAAIDVQAAKGKALWPVKCPY